mmetsp:Transcript_17325/g.67382  ORF Transcript_17325/g.67382 Transcript_17325/m.67382 type:complete len:226 (-) Transcript_17325:346-1023(-)
MRYSLYPGTRRVPMRKKKKWFCDSSASSCSARSSRRRLTAPGRSSLLSFFGNVSVGPRPFHHPIMEPRMTSSKTQNSSTWSRTARRRSSARPSQECSFSNPCRTSAMEMFLETTGATLLNPSAASMWLDITSHSGHSPGPAHGLNIAFLPSLSMTCMLPRAIFPNPMTSPTPAISETASSCIQCALQSLTSFRSTSPANRAHCSWRLLAAASTPLPPAISWSKRS